MIREDLMGWKACLVIEKKKQYSIYDDDNEHPLDAESTPQQLYELHNDS